MPSADCNAPADFTFQELVKAYFDCRRTKRNSASALAFEERLEHNLRDLFDELQAGSYTPGRSICFVITRPKAREVWAADFRDRIVHHLLHNQIGPRFYTWAFRHEHRTDSADEQQDDDSRKEQGNRHPIDGEQQPDQFIHGWLFPAIIWVFCWLP